MTEQEVRDFLAQFDRAREDFENWPKWMQDAVVERPNGLIVDPIGVMEVQPQPSDDDLMELAREECENFRWPSTALSIMRKAIAAAGVRVDVPALLTDDEIHRIFYPMGTATENQLLIARAVGRAIERKVRYASGVPVGATGREPELLQDCDRKLSRALANTPGARLHAMEAAAAAGVPEPRGPAAGYPEHDIDGGVLIGTPPGVEGKS